MPTGLLIMFLIIAIIIIHFFGFTVFWYCALAGIAIFLGMIIYILSEDVGHIRRLKNFWKKILKYYLKFETKFFKWLDDLFK